MLSKLALLVGTLAMLEGLAMASCTPGYAGSGYYQTRDCGLRLGPRAHSSRGYTYGYGYGLGYGHTIDAFIPTLAGPPLNYGYPTSLPHVPNWYAAPYLGQPHGGIGVVRGFRYSPRSPTRMRPQRRSSNVLPGNVRPGLRSGLGDLVGTRSRNRLAKITKLSNGVWINP